jgi:SpoVK/Ycf46/Vps4 family AAA+-type ATPase
MEEIDLLIRARYPIIYIVSYEESRVIDCLKLLSEKQGKELITWSQTKGFSKNIQDKSYQTSKDPEQALLYIQNTEEIAIFVLKDFHFFMRDHSVIRALRDVAESLKTTYKTLMIVSPVMIIPQELEKDLTVIDFDMPNFEAMKQILDRMIERVNKKRQIHIMLTESEREKLVKSVLGLTADEAENAFARVVVSQGTLKEQDIGLILAEKKQIIRKSGLLDYYETDEKFQHIGGLDNLKEWLEKRSAAFTEKARQYGLPEPRGILLVGVQGCGKSLTAKAVSSLWGLPLLRLDLGVLFSGIIGSSEENVRRAVRIAESVAPCILWLDEMEKGLSGIASSDVSDAGTTARVFGSFITWLQEKKTPVFVIATSNDIEKLPPETLRKGRFDDIFFIDLPTQVERTEIFTIHLQLFNRDPSIFDLGKLADESKGFSGAEIKESIISAMFDAFSEMREVCTDDIIKAISETIPLSKTMPKKINQLRSWAGIRARRASTVEPEEIADQEEVDYIEPMA